VPKGTPVKGPPTATGGEEFEEALYHGREDLLDGIVIRTPRATA